MPRAKRSPSPRASARKETGSYTHPEADLALRPEIAQAFFSRTGAWESLKKALKGDYDQIVWDHLAGTVSAPFTPGAQREIAVKVIDDRGNELLVVRKLEEGK